MRKARIDVSGIRKDPDYRTPTKTRILAGRVDQRKEEEFYMIGALPWA